MQRILILDTETTGLDPNAGATCIEVAACLYSIEHASPIDWASWLICHPTNEAEAINHISPALMSFGHLATDVWATLYELAKSADAIARGDRAEASAADR